MEKFLQSRALIQFRRARICCKIRDYRGFTAAREKPEFCLENEANEEQRKTRPGKTEGDGNEGKRATLGIKTKQKCRRWSMESTTNQHEGKRLFNLVHQLQPFRFWSLGIPRFSLSRSLSLDPFILPHSVLSPFLNYLTSSIYVYPSIPSTISHFLLNVLS